MKFLLLFLGMLLGFTFAAPIPNTIIDDIIGALNKFPPIQGLIQDVAGQITGLELFLASLLRIPTEQDGLEGSCKELTVIFARGVSESIVNFSKTHE